MYQFEWHPEANLFCLLLSQKYNFQKSFRAVTEENQTCELSQTVFFFFSLSADIDDMNICYVLLDGSNATSDIFYFTIEDHGRNHKILV